MTVIELSPGHPSYVGLTREQLIGYLHQRDKESWTLEPAEYRQPSWRERDVEDGATAPVGCEWYAVGVDGRLMRHAYRRECL